MKTPYEVSPEGTDGILNEVAMLHRQSSGYYRDLAAALKDEQDSPAGYFNSLGDYHDSMLTDINQILSDMAAGVHTPSRRAETEFKKNEKRLNRALQSKNIVELTDLAYDNERGVSETYKHALANDKLIDFAKDLLTKQHEKVLVWVNRAERYKTVPQDFNEHYDSDNKEK